MSEVRIAGVDGRALSRRCSDRHAEALRQSRLPVTKGRWS
jgi:hypothetical protein